MLTPFWLCGVVCAKHEKFHGWNKSSQTFSMPYNVAKGWCIDFTERFFQNHNMYTVSLCIHFSFYYNRICLLYDEWIYFIAYTKNIVIIFKPTPDIHSSAQTYSLIHHNKVNSVVRSDLHPPHDTILDLRLLNRTCDKIIVRANRLAITIRITVQVWRASRSQIMPCK